MVLFRITFKFDFPLHQIQHICTGLKNVTNSDRKSERKAQELKALISKLNQCI